MKIFKLFAAMAAVVACTASLTAVHADTTPQVRVNGHLIHFEEQDPVIINDVTMVPAKSVFRIMDCDVEWIGEELKVKIKSADAMTRVYFTIGDPNMTIYKFKNLWESDKTVVPLETAPLVLNDKTVIPMRALAEALNAEVNWDAEKFLVTVDTPDAPVFDENDVKFYLTADTDDVSKGDELKVYLNMENFAQYEGSAIANAALSLYYDPTKLKITNASIINEEGESLGGLNPFNEAYFENMLKCACVLTDFNNLPNSDGKIMEVTFEALADDGGELMISDGYMASRSYDTMIGVMNENGTLWELSPENAVFDLTPLVIK